MVDIKMLCMVVGVMSDILLFGVYIDDVVVVGNIVIYLIN